MRSANPAALQLLLGGAAGKFRMVAKELQTSSLAKLSRAIRSARSQAIDTSTKPLSVKSWEKRHRFLRPRRPDLALALTNPPFSDT
jgi:Tfp pilus assembly protein FimT